MGYNGSLTAECWKVHTCVNCTTLFRYGLKRSVTATGNSQEQCRQNLHAATLKALNEGVDTHPCPTCGMIAPEMVGTSRGGTFGPLGCSSVVLGCALAIALLCEVSISTLTWVGVILGGLLAAWALKTAIGNPNANLAGNLRQAEADVRNSVTMKEGQEDANVAPARDVAHLTEGKHAPALALILLSIGLLALPEVGRTLRGWSANPGFFPAVVGPGDEVTYYFHKSIHSIKGYWKGSVKAALNGQDVKAICKDNAWGDSISAKSSEKDSSADLWATLTLPSEAKSGTLKLKVDYVAPVLQSSGKFREEEGTVEETPELKLGSPGAGTAYKNMAWIAIFGGCGALAAGCFWLMKQADALKTTGRPVHTLAKEEAA